MISYTFGLYIHKHSEIARFLPSKFQLPSSEFDNAKFANEKNMI